MGSFLWCGGASLRGQDPGDKRSVHACDAAGSSTRAADSAGNLADIFTCEIGMVNDDRAVNQADNNLRPATRKLHQWSEVDQIQNIRRPPFLGKIGRTQNSGTFPPRRFCVCQHIIAVFPKPVVLIYGFVVCLSLR